jgi:hypothetical protein
MRSQSHNEEDEIAPGGSVEGCGVPEWCTGEDRPMKRCTIESRVSNGDASSGRIPRGPSEEVQIHWLLRSAATLEEDEVQSRGT